MHSEFLGLKPNDIIDNFLDDYSRVKVINDEDKEDIKKYIRYVKSRKESDKEVNIMKNEEIQWYSSLDNGEPDYSVYNSSNYFKEVLACYIVYSRDYLRRLTKAKVGEYTIIDYMKKNIGNNPLIADLGNGIGYTTVALSELFNTKVHGTNIRDTEQWDFNNVLKEKYNIEVHDNLELFNDIDIILASEYFEHIDAPFEHLEEIIQKYRPKFMIIANSFNKRAVGHFHNYKYKDEVINEKDSQKLFMKIAKSYGYTQVNTKLWNNTPIILEKLIVN